MIPLNELALAYQLRAEGCSWRNIAIGLGHSERRLKTAVMRQTLEPDRKCLNQPR